MAKNIEYVDGSWATLSIWDIGGQDRFESIRTTFYRGANGALLVFDLSRQETYDVCTKWLSEIREFVNDQVPFILIGNKLDLIEDLGEVVDREKAREFAESEDSIYIETSAKTGSNVEKAFLDLTNHIINKPKSK